MVQGLNTTWLIGQSVAHVVGTMGGGREDMHVRVLLGSQGLGLSG